MRAIFSSSVRAGTETRAVAPLELFFDLVYVFAVSQLAHPLVEHFDVRTGVQTLVLALMVIYAWYMTAWLSNWLSPDHRPVQVALLTIMLGSLVMASAIGEAFGDRVWLFLVPYVLVQIGRSAFAVLTFRPGSNQRVHFVNVLVWECAIAVLWVAGALAGDDAQLVLWAIAVALTYLGVACFHPVPGRPSHLYAPIGPTAGDAHSDLSGEHLLERGRLFFLIALGETLLTTGSAFAAQPVGVGPLAAFVTSFAAAVAVWYCYFQRAEGAGLVASERSADASGIAALATQVLTLMVLALLAIAIGDEFAIAHPGDDPGPGYLVLAFGGPALFLLAQLWFMWRVGAHGLRARAVGAGALVVLAVATSATTLLVAAIAATAVLVAVAVSDTRRAPSE
jgi:low temperature requirement protein LtrA